MSVVIPTMNEEAGIGDCLERVRSALEVLDVSAEIVVSDNSHDRTPEIAREFGARVVTPDEEGYGYAYQYGFDAADGDIIVMGDGDTTYDFTELPKLIAEVNQGADIVLGSRFDGEIKPGAMPPLHKYVGNPLLTWYLNAFYGASVTDAHSGFRVVTADAIGELDLTSNGMEFASEMVMKAQVAGLDIVEVPITYHPREGEATLDSFEDGWRHLKFMLVNAPNKLFLVPGAVFFFSGVLLTAIAFSGVRPFGQPLRINTLIAGSLLSVVGFQVISMAVFITAVAEPLNRAEGPAQTWIRDQFTLERGTSFGLLVSAAGGVYALSLVSAWYGSGFDRVPDPQASVVAATVIMIGVQMIFYAVFFSVAEETNDP